MDLAKGLIDVRRLTKISKIERVWLSYFLQIPTKYGGEYAKDFCNNFMNLSMSIDGERARQLILMQGAVSGGARMRKQEDKRNWIQRNITQRNKQPEDVLRIE